MKKSFAERYPNHRIEKQNEKIVQMIPAVGWWKARVFLDDNVYYEPVAFFAVCEWEERSVWDGGRSEWGKQQSVYANTGTGDEWFMDHLDEVFGSSNLESRLFYSPSFSISKEQQGIDDEWIAQMKEDIKKRIKT